MAICFGYIAGSLAWAFFVAAVVPWKPEVPRDPYGGSKDAHSDNMAGTKPPPNFNAAEWFHN